VFDAAQLLDRIAALEAQNQQLGLLNKQLELNVKQLASLVYVDPLTGLSNRRYFHSAIESELRRYVQSGRPLALLLCDIDYFKHYNDTRGHAHGDTVLVRIGALLQSLFAGNGGCVARYGGEEFAVLLPNHGYKEAVAAAERLRKGVAALTIQHRPSQTVTQVTVSVGVTCVCARAVLGGRVLIDAADAALYRAKHAGRNRVKLVRVPVAAD
jgi:diguanylate cyclase (GGDEF)-like protein